MRPVRCLAIYVLAVFVGGALLAPWLYHLTQALFPGSGLAANPFRRFVDRSFLGIAIIGIWPLARGMGIRSLRDIGLTKPAGQWNRLATGVAFGFSSVACIAVVVLLAHARRLNPDLTTGRLAGGLAAAAATAIGVAFIEELLFRGAVFGSLRKVWNWRIAMLVSSMIYAVVHFIGRADLPGAVTWSSGLQLLPAKFAGFIDPKIIVPGFFGLTIVGCLLAFAYQKTGNLYFSFGLHASWIFFGKLYDLVTLSVPGAPERFWGSGKMIDGWLALFVLGAFCFILAGSPLAKPKEPRP